MSVKLSMPKRSSFLARQIKAFGLQILQSYTRIRLGMGMSQSKGQCLVRSIQICKLEMKIYYFFFNLKF